MFEKDPSGIPAEICGFLFLQAFGKKNAEMLSEVLSKITLRYSWGTHEGILEGIPKASPGECNDGIPGRISADLSVDSQKIF